MVYVFLESICIFGGCIVLLQWIEEYPFPFIFIPICCIYKKEITCPCIGWYFTQFVVNVISNCINIHTFYSVAMFAGTIFFNIRMLIYIIIHVMSILNIRWNITFTITFWKICIIWILLWIMVWGLQFSLSMIDVLWLCYF